LGNGIKKKFPLFKNSAYFPNELPLPMTQHIVCQYQQAGIVLATDRMCGGAYRRHSNMNKLQFVSGEKNSNIISTFFENFFKKDFPEKSQDREKSVLNGLLSSLPIASKPT
jgi:hypothetical protein